VIGRPVGRRRRVMSDRLKIRKAVIPAAGLGTRFLPATKSVPKELLPIVDIPTIQYIVQEAVEAGIETVIVISSRGKGAIVDHFDTFPELEEKLKLEGKVELAEKLAAAGQMAHLVSLRQGKPLGLGHAVLCAKEVIGNEPFAVLLGDDLIDQPISCTKEMIGVFQEHKKSVVALMEVPKQKVSSFGICSGEEIGDRTIEIFDMVEKPTPEEAPSNTAIVGRYILTPRIFDLLERTKPGSGGEIQLTDAMAQLLNEEGIVGYQFAGKRYDTGDQFDFLRANLDFGLKRDELAPALKEYMRRVVAGESSDV
jgi:UTP--glucose-1-phosphate uridylyltransferase